MVHMKSCYDSTYSITQIVLLHLDSS